MWDTIAVTDCDQLGSGFNKVLNDVKSDIENLQQRFYKNKMTTRNT